MEAVRLPALGSAHHGRHRVSLANIQPYSTTRKTLTKAPDDLPSLETVNMKHWLEKHGKAYLKQSNLTAAQQEELKECFELMDSDGSGSIDAGELLTVTNFLGMRMSKATIEKILLQVDADGSGAMEFAEFLELVTNTLETNQNHAYTAGKRHATNDAQAPVLGFFRLMAQAFRRKKLLDGLIVGDSRIRAWLIQRGVVLSSENIIPRRRNNNWEKVALQRRATRALSTRRATAIAMAGLVTSANVHDKVPDRADCNPATTHMPSRSGGAGETSFMLEEWRSHEDIRLPPLNLQRLPTVSTEPVLLRSHRPCSRYKYVGLHSARLDSSPSVHDLSSGDISHRWLVAPVREQLSLHISAVHAVLTTSYAIRSARN
eukprot:jgi/Chlat1/3381/Chrsp23S03722